MTEKNTGNKTMLSNDLKKKITNNFHLKLQN